MALAQPVALHLEHCITIIPICSSSPPALVADDSTTHTSVHASVDRSHSTCAEMACNWRATLRLDVPPAMSEVLRRLLSALNGNCLGPFTLATKASESDENRVTLSRVDENWSRPFDKHARGATKRRDSRRSRSPPSHKCELAFTCCFSVAHSVEKSTRKFLPRCPIHCSQNNIQNCRDTWQMCPPLV